MKTTTNKKLYRVYIGVDLTVIAGSLFMGDLWLLNTQVAFMCSMLITIASFVSYKNMVNNRVKDGDLGDDRDLLDGVEDPYKLYDEERNEEMPAGEAEVVKKVGFKQSMKNLFSSYRGVFSPFRLASYGMLCLAVLFLIRHAYFDTFAFFVGLGIVPISSLIGIGFVDNNKECA